LCKRRAYRSPIYDRNGKILAGSRKRRSAFFAPSALTKDSGAFLEILQQYFPRAYQRAHENPSALFCFLKRLVSDKDAEWLRKTTSLVNFLEETERYYPTPTAAHILGLTNVDLSGIEGLELAFDEQLTQEDTKTAAALLRNSTALTEPKGLVCTLDSQLQHEITLLSDAYVQSLEAKSACIVVMDAQNGDILCMAQSCCEPSAQDKAYSLRNHAISDAYEMGSIIKAFCMLAALAEKKVDIDELINCHHSKAFPLRGIPVKTWKAHGKIPLKQVIRESNNIGIAQIALKLDKKLYDHYRQIGFGNPTGIRLPGEACGFITPPQAWSRQSLLSLSYGYEISTTLLQVTAAWSIFAQRGTRVKPRITFQESVERMPLYEGKVIEDAREIVRYESSHPLFKKWQELHGWDIFGKTGTANILESTGYNPERNAYTFVGNIEKENVNYIISVHVRESNKKGAYAASIALPLFAETAARLIRHTDRRTR